MSQSSPPPPPSGPPPSGPPPSGAAPVRPASDSSPRERGRTVPVKWVVAGVGALVVLALTFYAGMAYENHRIASAFEDAFSGFGEDGDSAGSGSGVESGGEDGSEPAELAENVPTEVTTYDGTFTVTLLGSDLRDGAAADDTLTRNLSYQLKIENSGDTAASPSTSTHFETDAGQVLDFAGVFCDEDSLPSDELAPGQFVQGCESSDLPDDAGRLVFDSVDPELYITVPAG